MNNESKLHLAGKFYLCRDAFNVWIEEEYNSKMRDGSSRKAFRRASGYFKNIKDVFQDFSEMEFRVAEAKDAQELLKQMADIQAKTEMLIKGVFQAHSEEK